MEHGRPRNIGTKNSNSSQVRACTLCGRFLDLLVLFYCPQKHPYCENCYTKFISRKGNESRLACLVCRYDPEKNLSPNISKQTITINYNHHIIDNLPVTKHNLSHYENPPHYAPSTSSTIIDNSEYEEEESFKKLIGLSKEDFYQSQLNIKPRQKHYSPRSKLTLPSSTMISKKPVRCPHSLCNKPVALAQFVNHFKCEHKDVPNFGLERGDPLRLSFEVSLIEYDHPFCMAMFTVYEINRMDYLRNPETSDKAVVKTCSKFCQTVPISTFWLLVAGSEEGRSSYAVFWLYTNSEEVHRCTLELSSSEDTISLTSCCQVSNPMDESFLGMQSSMHCLLVAKVSLVAMLREGPVLNLGVTVH